MELSSKRITAKQFLDIAEIIAQSSYAKRKKVGAVIVKNGNIISMGYNGTPSGFENNCEELNKIPLRDREQVNAHSDWEIVEQTKREVLHAESNAIAKCARGVVSTDGADLYTTVSPCFDCAKMIIQCGIKRVFYRELYRCPKGIDLLEQAKIEVYEIIH